MFGLGDVDESKVQQLVATLTGYLDAYEKILSKQAFIGGDSFSLVDVYHLPYGSMLFLPNVGYGHLINDRPHVKAWWDKITARESWKKANSQYIY